jgi:PIN domain nuclease of toxin-antitoxin system
VRLLLDTQPFVWWLADDDRLPRSVRSWIEDPATQVTLSVASVWECVIKAGAGRLNLGGAPEEVIPRVLRTNVFRTLGIEYRHALRVASLPSLHGDPFDRMLVAQALEEGLSIATGDRAISAYPVDVVW